MSDVTAIARVVVTVEFEAGGCWGADCTVAQIQKQAKESAMGVLRNGLIINGSKGSLAVNPTYANIIGEPKITAVFVDNK